jgi:DNA-binding transcriptional ArsR family regulator
MAKEKFLLVSLSENKAKQLAQAISNETCRKILDHLADKEATETELAEKLEIPISTVHYNLQQLQKGGLVISEEYHYSKKGKEINHYKLANKYIIIAPKSTYGIKEKLKSILPAALIIAAGAGAIQFFSRYLQSQTFKAAASAKEVAMEAAPTSAGRIPELAPSSIGLGDMALWFFIGAIAALALYLLIDWFRNRKS